MVLCIAGAKLIPDVENPHRSIIELPDGYQLIFFDGEYHGRHNPNLAEVI